MLLLFLSLLLVLILKPAQGQDYGVDVSFPMHHRNVSRNYADMSWNTNPSIPTPPILRDVPIQPLGDRQAFYDQLIHRCVDHYGYKGDRCIDNEKGRIMMALRQPQSMVNYTQTGFIKTRAPEKVIRMLKEFWDTNKMRGDAELWPPGSTYVNHWDQNTFMVNIEDKELSGGGYVLKSHIWNAVRDAMTQWTGQRLAECTLYGIRIYEEGAILATHVDRLPFVSSAIINVDQDVDEPWPLEVIGHDGIAHNVTLEPGDMILYESHSILHGRPFPLKGRFFANVLIHFEPIGPLTQTPVRSGDLPPYLIPGSPEEKYWRRKHPKGWKVMQNPEFTTGTTEAHHFAVKMDVTSLERVLNMHERYANAKDANGWTPLHEAVRLKHDRAIDIVRMLVERGADVNALTSEGKTPLFLTRFYLGLTSVSRYLEENGAKVVGPEV